MYMEIGEHLRLVLFYQVSSMSNTPIYSTLLSSAQFTYDNFVISGDSEVHILDIVRLPLLEAMHKAASLHRRVRADSLETVCAEPAMPPRV